MTGSNRALKVVLLVLLLVAVVLLPVACVGKPISAGEYLVDGLGAPRGISTDAEGNLLVAVAGTGGEASFMMAGPEGEAEVHAGLSGQIMALGVDGSTSTLLGGIPSYAAPMETTGIYRVYHHGDSLWMLMSGTAVATTGAFWLGPIVELDAASLAVKNIINVQGFEMSNDPDGNGFDSNPGDIAWGPDGTMYVLDTGGNSLMTWSETDGLQVVQTWPDNSVPTSIEIGENGDLYVGHLGAGLAPGAGKVEHWSNGELVESWDGLTTVTDILLDGDDLYAVQMFLFGEQGPGPGNVVKLTSDGVQVVQDNLPAPFGIAKGGDGSLFVTTGTIVMGPDMSGGIYKILR